MRPLVVAAGIVAVLVIGAIAFTYGRPAPHALPPALAATVEQHTVATAIDTAEIARLRRVAAAADSAQWRANEHAAAIAAHARQVSARADSLAGVAATAESAHDSASAWHAAYTARTAERDTLTHELAAKDSSLVDARLQIAAVDSALSRSQARASRADSVIAAAVTVVRSSDPPCRLAHFFACPSRTVVAIGSAIAGAGGALAARHALLH